MQDAVEGWCELRAHVTNASHTIHKDAVLRLPLASLKEIWHQRLHERQVSGFIALCACICVLPSQSVLSLLWAADCLSVKQDTTPVPHKYSILEGLCPGSWPWLPYSTTRN